MFPLTQSMPVKDPSSTLPYAFDWTAWLQPGEVFVSAVVTAPSGITLAQAASVNAGVITFWLSGGSAGNSYLIECEIQTNQGRTDSRSFNLTVQIR